MIALYIASTEAFAGKTSLSIALGKHLKREGLTVGYIKPLTTRVRQVGDQQVSHDAEFICAELELDQTLEDIAPVALTTDVIEAEIRSPQIAGFYRGKLVAAYERVSTDRDVVILEGVGLPLEGSLLDLAAPQVIELFDARVLVTVRYNDTLSVDVASGLRTFYHDRLVGIVLNAVPRSQTRFVQQVATPVLEDHEIPVLAVLPEERLLSSVSVKELIVQLNGECLCCDDHTDELVEYLTVGAMTAGSALEYFRRQPNKAVITGGDRHDVQLAALETSTRCLILTGNQRPSTVVLNRACELKVPIVVVESDTLTTVRMIEPIFGKTFLRQPRKSAHFSTMFEERFDFRRFYEKLGLQL
jgi:BioD-like phosphotransacetylase family protein